MSKQKNWLTQTEVTDLLDIGVNELSKQVYNKIIDYKIVDNEIYFSQEDVNKLKDKLENNENE